MSESFGTFHRKNWYNCAVCKNPSRTNVCEICQVNAKEETAPSATSPSRVLWMARDEKSIKDIT